MHELKRATTHAFQAVLEAALIAGMVGVLIASTAFAGRGGSGGNTSSGGGSCAVAPNPVAIGANWTMSAVNLPAGSYVDVYDADSSSTTMWMAQVSSTGTLSMTWHSYLAGTSTIRITTTNTKKASTLASCSFRVN
jgi:hypothetical protein